MQQQLRWILANLVLGGLLFAACTSAGNPLDGTNWSLKAYRDGQGEMTSVKTGSVATAQFQADKVSGIAGCNNFSSSYQVDGKRLSFSPAAATRKMCAEPPGIMEQEDAYLAALNQVQTFKMGSNSLEMQAANGDTLLEFVPAGQ